MINRRLQGEIGEIDDLIGVKIKLLRSQGWQGQIKKCREYYIVEDVWFRISTDGKAICVLKVEGLPNTFTLSDILLYEK